MRRVGTAAGGFTLVEVLVALSVLGLTMAAAATLLSSGLRLRGATRDGLAYQRDARALLTALRDDLANVVPAGPAPMIAGDAVVLWRRAAADTGAGDAPPELVVYRWSRAEAGDSLFVRLAAPVTGDVADAVDHEEIRRRFLRWAGVERAGDPSDDLVREDGGTRFGSRARLGGLSGRWTGFPTLRAAAFALGTPEVGDLADGRRGATVLVKVSPAAAPPADGPAAADPRRRMETVPDVGSTLTARLRLPTAAAIPTPTESDPLQEVWP